MREWRTTRGLSQHRLAVLLGVTQNAVARWESGQRKPPAMLELALETLDRRLKEEQPS